MMLRSQKKTNQIVFAFIFIGIALLVIFTTVIVINNKTFADKTYFKTVLDNAKGLGGKPAIYFKGLEIGRIDAFSLNPVNNDIEVDFYVFDNYKDKVVKYSALSGNQSMLSGDLSDFELLLPKLARVKQFESLPPGAEVPYITSELAQAYIRNGLIEVQGDSIESIIASVNTLLLNLQRENNPEAGSLFRILDRMAKMTDHLLTVTESLQQSKLLDESEQMVQIGKDMINQIPKTVDKINTVIDNANAVIQQADILIKNYQQPGQVLQNITEGKVPQVLDNANANLVVLQTMLKDVHAQREQLLLTIHSVQTVLAELEKTLQGLNNNPLLKPGIVPPQSNLEIEMND